MMEGNDKKTSGNLLETLGGDLLFEAGDWKSYHDDEGYCPKAS